MKKLVKASRGAASVDESDFVCQVVGYLYEKAPRGIGEQIVSILDETGVEDDAIEILWPTLPDDIKGRILSVLSRFIQQA